MSQGNWGNGEAKEDSSTKPSPPEGKSVQIVPHLLHLL